MVVQSEYFAGFERESAPGPEKKKTLPFAVCLYVMFLSVLRKATFSFESAALSYLLSIRLLSSRRRVLLL